MDGTVVGDRSRRRGTAMFVGVLVAMLVGFGAPLAAAAAPGPGVTGQVASPFGPAPGVSVKVMDSRFGNVIASTTTDATGNYAVPLSSARDVKVEVSDPSGVYPKTYNGDTPLFVAAPTVSVTTAPVVVNITVPSNHGVIAGTVTDTSGAPLAGIRVDFSSAVYGNVFRTTTTDGNGRYQSPLMPPTAYRVQFSDPGGRYASLWNGGAVKFDRASDVVVVANSSTTADGTLPVAAHLTGRVTAGGTLGVGGLYVLVGTPATPSAVIGAAITASDGSYTIGNVPAGPYKLAFIDPAIQTSPTHTLRPVFHANVDVLSYPNLDAGFLDATPVMVGEGATVTVDQRLVGVACPTVESLPSLAGASLANADVRGCDFSSTSLRGANIAATDLAGVNLTDALLGNAPGTPVGAADATYRNTECPDFTNSDSHGNTCVGHFALDTTPPVVSVTGPASVEWGPAVMTVTATDATSGIVGPPSCRVDGVAAAVNGAGPWTVNATGVGGHTVSCSATDRAGNAGTASRSVTITPDVTKPVISVGGGTSTDDPAVVVVTATDSGSGLTGTPACTIDGALSTPSGSGPWTLSVSGEGPHTVSCTAVDRSGNTAGATASLVIDTIDPDLTLAVPSVSATQPVAATVTASDLGTGLAGIPVCTVDGDVVALTGAAGTWAFTVTGIARHDVECDVDDVAGNTAIAVSSVQIDPVAPLVAVTAPAVTNTNPFLVTVSASDADSGLAGPPACTVDGAATSLPGGAGTWTISVLGNGSHTVVCVATDLAGNASSASASTLLDSVAPSLSVGLAAATASDPVTATISASDASSGLAGPPTCTVDGAAAVVAGTGPWTLPVGGEGSHVVGCTAVDLAGNTRSATSSTVIDATKPSLTVTGPTVTAANPALLTVSATDTGTGLAVPPSCTVDGSPAALVGAAGPWSLSVAGAGNHLVACQVDDRVGNRATATTGVIIDTSAPVVTLAVSPVAALDPVAVTVSASDSGSGLAGEPACTVDGAPVAVSGGAGAWQFSVAGEGVHTLGCTVSNNVGQVGSVGGTVRVDTTVPTIALTAPATSRTTPVIVSVTAADGGSGLAGSPTCAVDGGPVAVTGGSGAWTFAVGAQGSHLLACTVSDAAGNSASATAGLQIAAAAPVGVDDAYNAVAGTTTTVAAPGVLGNDSDADGDPLTAVLVTVPAHGSLTLDPAGSFAYLPAAGYTGADSFTYRASDGVSLSNLVTVRITVASPPVFTPLISTAVGTGTSGFSGDGAAATAARVRAPRAVAVDVAGNLYVADTGNNRIRKVAAGTGVITTVAGTGAAGFAGDGGPAVSAQLNGPRGVAIDAAGNLYISDTGNHRIRLVSASTGGITTYAGTGTQGYAGDGGAAVSARFNSPAGVAVDTAGNLYIADANNHRIRMVSASSRVVTTVAGTGTGGYSGDGGPATAARVRSPQGVAVDAAGNVLIADTSNNRIRRVSAATGIITTVAGNGGAGSAGDGGPATRAQLRSPNSVAVDQAGNLFFADRRNNKVRKVTASTGIITTLAGTGTSGFSGDGGAATTARLNAPRGIAVDGDGNVLVADTGNNRVRRVSTGPLRLAKVGTAYSSTFVLTGTAPVLTVLSGALPPGIGLTGLTISGTPTLAGTYRGVIRATNAGGTADTFFTIVVAP